MKTSIKNMKRKISLIALIVGVIALSGCNKTKCTCTEKQYSADKDIANQRTGTNTERAVYNYKVGEKAMLPDGSMIEYTKEYIEKQKSELEATGKFDCEWKY